MRAEDITGIAALDDEVRRDLYLFVCSRPEPVGRDEAAQTLDIPRHRAKFHLDKLEESGLLVSDYRRLTGRTGPGAGRPAKVYRRADQEVSLSLPARNYGLAGELMAQAITRSASSGEPVYDALAQVAHAYGSSMADGPSGDTVVSEGAVTSEGAAPSEDVVAHGDTTRERALDRLRDQGYEPRVEGERILMQNCPFHALAHTHTELVCRMNHALLCGMVERIAPDELRADLDPAPGRCCVALRTTAPDDRSDSSDQPAR